MSRANSVFVLAVICGAMGGCDRYMDRRDQVTFGTGDAVAANRAMHIIDPWPRGSQTLQHGISGEQAEGAMEKFRRRAAAKDTESAPSPSGLPPAPSAPPKP